MLRSAVRLRGAAGGPADTWYFFVWMPAAAKRKTEHNEVNFALASKYFCQQNTPSLKNPGKTCTVIAPGFGMQTDLRKTVSVLLCLGLFCGTAAGQAPETVPDTPPISSPRNSCGCENLVKKTCDERSE